MTVQFEYGRVEERGAALVTALFFAILAFGIVATGTSILETNRTRTTTHHLLYGQATQAAQGGLDEAANWLRRQTAQPVEVFSPARDELASPPVLDTDEPEVGLVREFQIHGDLWARYEVWREWDTDPDPVRLERRRLLQATDVSAARFDGAESRPVSAWLLYSTGYVFRRRDPAVAFDVRPNVVLATETLETEVSRLYFSPPGHAAISGRMGGPIVIHENVTVLGHEGTGIYYQAGNGSPNTESGSVLGEPSVVSSTSYDDSAERVFGISESALRALAHYVLSDGADFPSPLPDYSIVFIEETVSTLQFDELRPLIGKGIVYAQGNLSIKGGSLSDFEGLLYVKGHLNVNGPAHIAGAVVGQKGMNFNGSSGPVLVEYSSEALRALTVGLGGYRMSRAVRRAFERD